MDRETLRAEVHDWVGVSWDPSLELRAWRERLLDAGWAVPSWPARWYGKGLPAWADDVVRGEIRRGGAVATVPAGLAGPTILEHGPDHLRGRFLRPLLTGDEAWCQLFSEPAAGSDLAGLTTTAVLDGDEWVVRSLGGGTRERGLAVPSADRRRQATNVRPRRSRGARRSRRRGR